MKKHARGWSSDSRKKGSKIGQFFKSLLENLFLAGGKSPKNNRNSKKGFPWKALLRNLVLLGIAAFLLGAILFLGMFAWISRDLPDPNSLSEREVAQSTKIYDSTGEHLLYEIAGDEKRTLIELSDLPDYVAWATITAEDRKFYEHGGVDYRGILRALLFNVATLDPTGQGGSTITQQLVKNAILTTEQTYTRKIKEVILAIALERRYTKDEILQLYLNEIPYGSTNYGIESAAQAYFGISATDLTLAQAATIAALPKAPTTFLNNPDRLLERRNWILESMAELEFISEDDLALALAEESFVDIHISNIEAPHFVLWVKEQLVETYGERMVEQGGLEVITTLNYEEQKQAEQSVLDNAELRSEQYGFNNSSLVALDPSNGHIRAMVGSRDYFDDDIDGQVNVALRPLQPGSSFKPIVYTAAFERGYTPNTIVWDVETTFGTATGSYSPKNYDLQEHGPVSLREALQGSLNIPAVKALYLAGVDYSFDFAERLHYSTLEDRSQFGLSVVLGGAEVPLLEHVAAYATFANEGVYHEPVAILEVRDKDDTVLQQWEESEGEQVIEPQYAHMISNVLSDNGARTPYFGASSYLNLGDRPAAAKTGTTNSYKDAWTVGYTPSLVAGVWTGNTDGTAMNRGSGGSAVAAPIWNQFMKSALEGVEAESFPAVSIPSTGKAMLDGSIPAELIEIDTVSGLLATDLTPDKYREEKMCGEYHTILTYVDIADPLGDIPSDPSSDPYYGPWEAAIEAYIARHNESLEEGEVAIEVCEIPTEEDNVHTKANQPDIKIEEPNKKDEVGRTFRVDLDAEAPRGISRIEYYIDGTLIETSSLANGKTITLPSWVGIGDHTLKVIAYDDIDNAGSDDVKIEVTEAGSTESFSITNPFNGQQIDMAADTLDYTLVLEAANADAADSMKITVRNLWTGATQTITVDNPTSVTSAVWTINAEGSYFIEATLESGDGNIDAQPVTVLVQQQTEAEISLLEDEGEAE